MDDQIDIAEIRTALKLNQTEFAALLGVRQGDVSNWENKKHKPSRLARAAIVRLVSEYKKKAVA